jgi:hypothetical protein
MRCTSGSMRGMCKRGYGKQRQTKETETDKQTYCYRDTSLLYLLLPKDEIEIV